MENKVDDAVSQIADHTGMEQYDSQNVIDSAEAKLQEGDISGAQKIYQSSLLEWVDDATMGDTVDQKTIRENIVNLWLAYADLNRRSNLFKSATEVYEQATNCLVAGSVGKIWLKYALFLDERTRPKTAQKIYLRALVGGEGNDPAVKDETDQKQLWNEFLRMMRVLRKNPQMTLDVLRKAVEQEHTGQIQDSEFSTDDALSRRPPKRSRWDNKTAVEVSIAIETVSASNIDASAGSLLSLSRNMPSEFEAAWHARDGGSPPSRPEPALFTASPPKLGDPSGKDLLGSSVALQLVKMLTSKTHDGKAVGSPLLELCHACWMMTSIKEEEALKAHQRLENKINADLETLETNLQDRTSVAGGALAAVQQANEHERNQFELQSSLHRDRLLATIAWEFRKLLYVQQTIFTSVKLPGFDGPTVDSSVIAFQANVCSVMHSAFYLRGKVGEVSHMNMLNKQVESLEKLATQSTANQPAATLSQYQQPMQFQQLQPMQFQQQNPEMAGINSMPVPLVPAFGQQQQMYPVQQQPMGYQAPAGFPSGQTMQPGMIVGGMQMMQQPMMQQPQQFMGQRANPNHFQHGQQNRPR